MLAIESASPIEERSAVDRATFEGEIVPGGRPVVLRGQVADWPAVRAGGTPRGVADYLLRFVSPRPAEVLLGLPEIGGRFFYNQDMSGFNYGREDVPLRRIIEQLLKIADHPDPPAVYAGAASAPDFLPGFADANPMPLIDASVSPRVWTGNATVVSIHHDVSPNIACVMAGRREFLLFPPDQLPNLYVGPLDFNMAGRPVSLVDPAKPDLDRFPRFAEAMRHARIATLTPGDAIYMPSLWWHQVRAQGPLNVLVNYWWKDQGTGPTEAMIHALLAIRDLPEQERADWRMMFDHYVFGDGQASVAHLPERVRGVLGAPSSERERHIRRFLAQQLMQGLD